MIILEEANQILAGRFRDGGIQIGGWISREDILQNVDVSLVVDLNAAIENSIMEGMLEVGEMSEGDQLVLTERGFNLFNS